MNRYLVILIILIATVACGKKGNPQAPELFAPVPVSGLSARASVDGVTLRWSAPALFSDEDIAREPVEFEIQRSVEQGRFQLLSKVTVPRDENGIPSQADFVHKDSDLEAGQTYQYMVVPLNRDGVQSPAHNIVAVTFIGEASVINVR